MISGGKNAKNKGSSRGRRVGGDARKRWGWGLQGDRRGVDGAQKSH